MRSYVKVELVRDGVVVSTDYHVVDDPTPGTFRFMTPVGFRIGDVLNVATRPCAWPETPCGTDD